MVAGFGPSPERAVGSVALGSISSKTQLSPERAVGSVALGSISSKTQPSPKRARGESVREPRNPCFPGICLVWRGVWTFVRRFCFWVAEGWFWGWGSGRLWVSFGRTED